MKRLRAACLAFINPGLVEEVESLTGALTRKRFEQMARRELARAKRGEEVSLVFIDLDSLKKVNDTEGHKAGDRYLREFARISSTSIRPYDLLARFGGDEFVLLLPGTDEVRAESVIRRIYSLFPAFSWGISSWSEGMTLEVLLAQADARMYQMKTSKKSKGRGEE